MYKYTRDGHHCTCTSTLYTFFAIRKQQPVVVVVHWCYVEASRARNVTDSSRSMERNRKPTDAALQSLHVTGPPLHLAGRSRDSFRPTTASRMAARAPQQKLHASRGTAAGSQRAWPTAGRCHRASFACPHKSDPSSVCLDVNYARIPYPMHALHTPSCIVRSCFIRVVALLFKRRLPINTRPP